MDVRLKWIAIITGVLTMYMIINIIVDVAEPEVVVDTTVGYEWTPFNADATITTIAPTHQARASRKKDNMVVTRLASSAACREHAMTLALVAESDPMVDRVVYRGDRAAIYYTDRQLDVISCTNNVLYIHTNVQ